MYVYALFKCSIILNELIGIFTDIDLAKPAANYAKQQESDDYHGFEVRRMRMNTADFQFDDDVTVYTIDGRIAEWPGTN